MEYMPMTAENADPLQHEWLGVYIRYADYDINALRHLLEFLKKRFHVSETDMHDPKKVSTIISSHPYCSLAGKEVSLRMLLRDMYMLDEDPDLDVVIGFYFYDDRTTFRQYVKELEQTRDEDLQNAREIYGEVRDGYFPDKERMN